MTRTWQLIRFHALLAALLAATPTFADDTPKNTDKPDPAQKQLNELKEMLAETKRDLKKDIKDLRAELNNNRTDFNTHAQGSLRDIEGLKEEIARLKTDLEALRKSSNTVNRQSGFAPSSTTAPAATGRVELINTWPGEVSVAVNNRVYRLLPGERRITDPMPAGTFTYEVINVTEPNRVRPLTPNQVYTIHIHP
jgi:ribosomal protein L29